MNKQRQTEEAAKIDGIDISKPQWKIDNTQMMCGGVGLKDLWPDYHNDYNAVHRLIAGMSDGLGGDLIKYAIELCKVVAVDHMDCTFGEFRVIHQATCAQMLEAILKAYGVWEES